ncbi:hypothetical protein [Kitasatospora sp. NPDC059327]
MTVRTKPGDDNESDSGPDDQGRRWQWRMIAIEALRALVELLRRLP